jgi:hypothetical protein
MSRLDQDDLQGINYFIHLVETAVCDLVPATNDNDRRHVAVYLIELLADAGFSIDYPDKTRGITA